MKCEFLLVLFFVGVLSCAGQEYSKADSFKISLIWPNSYCLTNDHDCRPSVPQYFTINGLWAVGSDGEVMENCKTGYYLTDKIITTNKVDLLKFWPDLSTYNFQDSKKLWKSQWETYGSCAADLMLAEGYISKAMNLRQSHNLYQILTNAGIVANGSSYKADRILTAIRKSTKFMVDIVCETDRVGNVYFSEVIQCLDNHGKEFVDCENKANNCDKDPIFPDPLFTSAAVKARRNASPMKRVTKIHA
ncbi:hypothetical protein L6164_005659 [Bauhinia variegata]|uniref:Uncharacterized protein n=1 Tax=Bauhinia variegata TaxID=167791 RepID=A0ACB9PRH9_BAUVA|nr:hypothetical protein L6164_005659 [Bauhinia variegata]